MAIKNVNWNDGSTDVLKVTYQGTSGTSPISVSTEIENEWTDREVKVALKTTSSPIASVTLNVKQEGKRLFYATSESSKYVCSDGKAYCVKKEGF